MENFTLATNYSIIRCILFDNLPGRMPFLFFYLVVIITAIPSNIFSLYVAWQHIRQKNELGVYLFNLALSDLKFSVGLSLWVDFLWKGTWVHGYNSCLLSATILFTNFYSSDAFLCCIAVDRYLAVVHPLKYTSLRKVSTAAGVSVAIWVMVFCFNAFTITWEELHNEKFKMCFDVFKVPVNFFMGNVLRFFIGFVFPVLLVSFSTWRIHKAVKSNQATDENEQKRITKLLAVILLGIVLCFGPIHIVMLLQSLMMDCNNAWWLLYIDKICLAISSLNSLLDPFLYCFITRAGKANVNQMVLFFQVKKRTKDEECVV